MSIYVLSPVPPTCAACGKLMAYTMDLFPDSSQSFVTAWCVNGERGCRQAGKRMRINAAQHEESE